MVFYLHFWELRCHLSKWQPLIWIIFNASNKLRPHSAWSEVHRLNRQQDSGRLEGERKKAASWKSGQRLYLHPRDPCSCLQQETLARVTVLLASCSPVSVSDSTWLSCPSQGMELEIISPHRHSAVGGITVLFSVLACPHRVTHTHCSRKFDRFWSIV